MYTHWRQHQSSLGAACTEILNRLTCVWVAVERSFRCRDFVARPYTENKKAKRVERGGGDSPLRRLSFNSCALPPSPPPCLQGTHPLETPKVWWGKNPPNFVPHQHTSTKRARGLARVGYSGFCHEIGCAQVSGGVSYGCLNCVLKPPPSLMLTYSYCDSSQIQLTTVFFFPAHFNVGGKFLALCSCPCALHSRHHHQQECECGSVNASRSSLSFNLQIANLVPSDNYDWNREGGRGGREASGIDWGPARGWGGGGGNVLIRLLLLLLPLPLLFLSHYFFRLQKWGGGGRGVTVVDTETIYKGTSSSG